jgi:hypothetical protein
MEIGQELWAVVLPDGEVLNCWTSPNRLYDSRASANRVRNQFIREAEARLAGIDGPFRENKKYTLEMAAVRQESLDRFKTSRVVKVIISEI